MEPVGNNVNFSEQPPSKQWAALKYRGANFAGVWFKPEGEPFALWLRVPRKSFELSVIGQQLTPELLLRAVGISAEEIEFCRLAETSGSGANGSPIEPGHLLPPLPDDVTHCDLYVGLKPAPGVAPEGIEELEIPEAKWQYLEGRWSAILVVEASVDAQRLSAETLRIEMEGSAHKALALEEKVNALSSDLVQWNKAKSRIRYAVPKLREFIHRATWAAGAAERKRVEDYFTNHVRPRIPLLQLDRVVAQFDALLKNRQVLAAQGVLVSQECRSILAEVEGSYRTLQRNAASKAAAKKSITGKKGKYY